MLCVLPESDLRDHPHAGAGVRGGLSAGPAGPEVQAPGGLCRRDDRNEIFETGAQASGWHEEVSSTWAPVAQTPPSRLRGLGVEQAPGGASRAAGSRPLRNRPLVPSSSPVPPRASAPFLARRPRGPARSEPPVTPPRVCVCFALRPRCRRPPIVAVVTVTPAPPIVLLTYRCRLLVLESRSLHLLCVSLPEVTVSFLRH